MPNSKILAGIKKGVILSDLQDTEFTSGQRHHYWLPKKRCPVCQKTSVNYQNMWPNKNKKSNCIKQVNPKMARKIKISVKKKLYNN